MFKFLHAADIHLDSPLKGLERYEGAPVDQIRNASRRALNNLVETAIDERVDFVLIAGDLYDGDWPDYNTGLYFIRQAQRLKEYGIPLFLISGNHDAANRMTHSLSLPDNVTRFAHRSAETAVLDDLGIAIHGQSFATQAVRDDLSQGYPSARKGLFNIGLLHTSANGRPGHEPYAPCTIEGLQSKDYHYWALGHVHQREILCQAPYVVFPGNIQGRHIRETGEKGCQLVTVDDDHSIQMEFQPLDVFRWHRAVVDVSELETAKEVLDQVSDQLRELFETADGRPLAVRIELSGASPGHRALTSEQQRWTNEMRAQALEAGEGAIWVEKVRFRTQNHRRQAQQESAAEGPIGELMELFDEIRSDPQRLGELEVDFSDLTRKLPTEMKNLVSLDDSDWLSAVLDEAESKLASRLLGKEDS